MDVYMLYYVKLYDSDLRNEIFIIGYFDDLEKLNKTIERYKDYEGFNKNKNNFITNRLLKNVKQQDIIYEVAIYMHDEAYYTEFEEVIGYYLNEEDAQADIDHYYELNKKFLNNSKYILEKFVTKISISERHLAYEGGFNSNP